MSDINHEKDFFQNRVVEFFANKTILVTGGTGFLGKVLIEKLLRCCSSLQKIYVIIRPKKDKSARERLRQILNGPLFDVVKREVNADILQKVEAISGDVSASDLNLSHENRQKLIDEVEIIYHSAATVRFDETLKSTILLNVRGTKLMLDLAKECKKLLVFSYVSTAYCHEDQDVVFEKFYPPPADPHQIISLCECIDEKVLESISSFLRRNSANNYTFSKALAEALVEEEVDNLPVIVQRPSAVIPIWREPLPGWTDNINGPGGLFIGAGKGVIRTMYARDDVFVDCLPVDIVVNALILSTYHYYFYGNQRVFNLTASEESENMGITAKSVLDMGRDIIKKRVAFDTVLWYPNGSLKQSKLHHYIDFVLYQLLPAFIIDIILLIIGTRPFMLKVQKRIWKGYQVLEYFANRKWKFDNKHSREARKLLNPEEREMFTVYPDGLDTYEYFVQCAIACRRYIMHEKDEDIPRALWRMKMMRFLDLFCKTLFLVGLLYFVSNFLF